MIHAAKLLMAAAFCCAGVWLWGAAQVHADSPVGPVKHTLPKPGPVVRITSVTPSEGTDGSVIVRGNMRLDKASAVLFGGLKSTAFSVNHDGSLSAIPNINFWGTGAGPWTVPVTAILNQRVLPTNAFYTAAVGAVRVTVPEPVPQPFSGGPEYNDTFWNSGGGHSFLLGPVTGPGPAGRTQLVTEPKYATFYVDTIVSNSGLPFSQKFQDGGEGAAFGAFLFMCYIGNDLSSQLTYGVPCTNWDGHRGVWVQAKCAKVSWSGKPTPGASAGFPALLWLDTPSSSRFANSKDERFKFDASACFDAENLARTFYYNVQTDVLQRKWFPFPGRGASQNSPSFNIVVGPAAFLQMNVIPYSILFQPPGDQSTISYTLSKNYGTQFSLAKSKSVDNKTSTSQSSSLNFAESMAFILGFSGGSGSQTTSTTLQDFGTVAGSGKQGSSSLAFSVTHTLGAETNLVPGSAVTCNATATSVCASTSQTPDVYANEPFWYDTFFLIIRPQFAIWVVGGKADRYQLYGAVPVIGQISVIELYSCATGNTVHFGDVNPCEIHTSGADLTANRAEAIVDRGEKIKVILTAADAQNLLKLDPFYGGGQDADVSPARGTLIYSGQYGGSAGTPSSSVVENFSNTRAAQLNRNGQTTYGTDITNTTASTSSFGMSVSLSLGAQEGASKDESGNENLGGYGDTGQTAAGNLSLTVGSQNQTSTENDTTLNYQNSTAVSNQIVTSASVTLNDSSNCPVTSPPSPPCHGPLETQPSVNVYFDRIFGGFMFQDPYAPKIHAREKAPVCCALLVRALVAHEKNNPRFVDVPASAADAGEIGLLARAGVLPGYADGTFKPSNPFTREQLAVVLEQGARLPSSTVNAALAGISVNGPITQAQLDGAFQRAGLKTPSPSQSNTALTRAAAADWIFSALKDR